MADATLPSAAGADAARVARALGLAAAPTFAIMAVWNGFFCGPPAGLCVATPGAAGLSGMTAMYLLMCAFHLSPWLRLFAERRAGI